MPGAGANEFDRFHSNYAPPSFPPWLGGVISMDIGAPLPWSGVKSQSIPTIPRPRPPQVAKRVFSSPPVNVYKSSRLYKNHVMAASTTTTTSASLLHSG